eukprot:TRINITY_DN12153_c0_g1_i2.p1 TRINITY_DN12153_c0_g1~~TRINITY_DN12153_c0_g1_i2.p1  ORF type:complete len:258 (-),score=23.63 TRINITY_DN12153_c0_g1_i2:35-808(-)
MNRDIGSSEHKARLSACYGDACLETMLWTQKTRMEPISKERLDIILRLANTYPTVFQKYGGTTFDLLILHLSNAKVHACCHVVETFNQETRTYHENMYQDWFNTAEIIWNTHFKDNRYISWLMYHTKAFIFILLGNVEGAADLMKKAWAKVENHIPMDGSSSIHLQQVQLEIYLVLMRNEADFSEKLIEIWERNYRLKEYLGNAYDRDLKIFQSYQRPFILNEEENEMNKLRSIEEEKEEDSIHPIFPGNGPNTTYL